MTAWWPHQRAVLITTHLFAVAAQAFPAPSGGMTRSTWKQPTVQAEFAAWRERLAGMGIEVTAEEFEEQLWNVAKSYMDVRREILAPMRHCYLYAGTWQSWRMFVAPHRFPGRLHIDIEQDGVYRPVYVGRSNEHTWLREVFDHDRMRSATFRYAWRKYRRTYRELGKWVAVQAARDFPEADKVRLQFYRYETLSPEAARAGDELDGEMVFPLVFKLEAHR